MFTDTLVYNSIFWSRLVHILTHPTFQWRDIINKHKIINEVNKQVTDS